MLKLNSQKTLLAKTATSDVFLNSEKDQVLKVLNEVGLKDELSGLYFLKACQGKEGCVKLIDYDENSMLLEYLPGENLYQFSKMGSEEQASEVFVKIIKDIQIPTKDLKKEIVDGLVDLKTLFPILKSLSFPPELESSRQKAIKVYEDLLRTQSEEVLLHGDLHHENIKRKADGSFACYDPKGYLGDPSYELGTTLKNPWDYPEISHSSDWLQKRIEFFSDELSLPRERILGFAFVHVCLSIGWALEDDCPFDHQRGVLKALEDIYSLKR